MVRMRIIAGPNGSGKSFLTKWLRKLNEFQFGVYINADEIETGLRKGKAVVFSDFGLKGITDAEVRQFYDGHSLKEKAYAQFNVHRNKLHLEELLPEQTYFGTLLSDFIRQKALAEGISFSFETVMSGSDKLRLLQQAVNAGYRVYLYFICTEDPLINMERVADRVRKQGHYVPDELVIARYNRTLENLIPATDLAYRTYMFDNSGLGQELVCEVFQGKEIKLNADFLPNWFKKHYLNRL
jgi:predicted ABC-type ATPase